MERGRGVVGSDSHECDRGAGGGGVSLGWGGGQCLKSYTGGLQGFARGQEGVGWGLKGRGFRMSMNKE